MNIHVYLCVTEYHTLTLPCASTHVFADSVTLCGSPGTKQKGNFRNSLGAALALFSGLAQAHYPLEEKVRPPVCLAICVIHNFVDNIKGYPMVLVMNK